MRERARCSTSTRSPCPVCHGQRLRPEALAVTFDDRRAGRIAAAELATVLLLTAEIANPGRGVPVAGIRWAPCPGGAGAGGVGAMLHCMGGSGELTCRSIVAWVVNRIRTTRTEGTARC
jgi:hypothetical protein